MFLAGLVVGCLFGTGVTIFVFALCVAAGDDKHE